MSKFSDFFSKFIPSSKKQDESEFGIEVHAVGIIASPDDLEKIAANPYLVANICLGSVILDNSGFLSKHCELCKLKQEARKIMDNESDPEVADDEKLNETLRKAYDLFMENVEFLKKHPELLSAAESMIDTSCYESAFALNDPESESFNEAIIENFLFCDQINALETAIEKEGDQETKEKLCEIRNKCLVDNPIIYSQYYEIGVPKLFGEDPIADVATKLGGISYEEATDAISEHVSGFVDFYVDSFYKNDCSADEGFYAVLYSCFRFLPQEKIDEVKQKVGNDKNEKPYCREMVMDYQKNPNNGNDKQDS